MLRFNSMRQVLDGTFEIKALEPEDPVWFCGNTTIDVKGKNVSFGKNVFQGTGTVTLTDSVGGGSVWFKGLDGFKGTLKYPPTLTVSLPYDMSNFAGTLHYEGYGATFDLLRSLPASATVYVDANTQIRLGNNVMLNATLKGKGVVSIENGTATVGNMKEFNGSISLGGLDQSVTLTVNAGEEKNVSIWNGTLRLVLSKEQIAYGYTSNGIDNNEDILEFIDENGNLLKRWVQSSWYGDDVYSIKPAANTWTPDEYGTGSFSDTAR